MALIQAEVDLAKTIVCNGCHIEKPLADYSDGSIRCKQGKHHTCKMCHNTRRKIYRESNPELITEQKRMDYKRNKIKRKIANKKWRDSHKEKIRIDTHNRYMQDRGRHRECNLLRNYGIDSIEYNEMYIIQNGCCAICGVHQSKLKRSLHVDHNHKTKEIRGLLCWGCNVTLGCIKENVDILKSMIIYLTKKETSNVSDPT